MNTTVTNGGVSAFTKNLWMGSTGAEVQRLQQYLNTHGYRVAASGAGSAGSETMTFGALTKAALAQFQAAVGISPAAGYFGPITRAYINAH
ncbi:peptidoglycan-binding protein [Candidatus Kaiserbacteria bacterium]|nr:peptidoglycan-binding protein [Candidatus Kaiserbacteria bacterium]